MSQYYAERLVRFRLPFAALCPLDGNSSSDGGSFYSNPQVLTAQITAYRQMDEARKSVIEDTPMIQSSLIYSRIKILRSQLQATREEKASEAVSGNRASGVR